MKKILISGYPFPHHLFWGAVYAALNVLVGIATSCQYKDYECIGETEHNMYRKMYNDTPSLQLDAQLNEVAQKCAHFYLQKATIDHSCDKGSFGENLYSFAAKKVANMTNGEIMQKAVKAWHVEVKDYDFKKGEFSKATGHFTQLIWRDTAKLGIGFAKNDERKNVYVVAIYTPEGNIEGEFIQNVQPVKQEKPTPIPLKPIVKQAPLKNVLEISAISVTFPGKGRGMLKPLKGKSAPILPKAAVVQKVEVLVKKKKA